MHFLLRRATEPHSDSNNSYSGRSKPHSLPAVLWAQDLAHFRRHVLHVAAGVGAARNDIPVGEQQVRLPPRKHAAGEREEQEQERAERGPFERIVQRG